MNLVAMSDGELMDSLRRVCAEARRLLACLLVHLNEVEARRLDAKSACPSLYEFCIRRLGMSDGEACRRIAAARLVKRFPSLLARVESGALTLTTLHLLRDHFTESNVERLASEASGRTKREVELLIARVAPKPDVVSRIEALPVELPNLTPSPLPAKRPARVVALSESRHEVRFTASSSLREKIERSKDLLSHRVPNGDLEAVMERAFDALLKQLEKERLAATSRPQSKPREASPSTVRASVRRAVFERYGFRYVYVDATGRRCECTKRLELDHIIPKAKGGPSTVSNLRVLCRAHNRLSAESEYGREKVASEIHHRQQWSKLLAETERGLVNLGFRQKETREALARLRSTHTTPPPIEQLVREALAALT